ncbi:DUF805 domain-containing protein [Macrococcus lamae]|uniref:DUF805 domain-containing protein n=1 Tax=Macrococcus lamae TaxID=198484 RepID=A0A4R6BW79_9STAP|nr:DUF805 domain-containing protein [Macrococcus lamae]TDM12280.1 DUF805 domain-containing protein [Macrococcus lamae]
MDIKMTALEAYKRFWTQAFVLDERARRKEFWVPFIIHFVLTILLFIVIMLITDNSDKWLTRVQIMTDIVLAIPFFSVTFRRLQDLNLTGWLALPTYIITTIYNVTEYMELDTSAEDAVSFCYFVGALLFFAALTFDGTEGPNRYGHDPREIIDEFNPKK